MFCLPPSKWLTHIVVLLCSIRQIRSARVKNNFKAASGALQSRARECFGRSEQMVLQPPTLLRQPPPQRTEAITRLVVAKTLRHYSSIKSKTICDPGTRQTIACPRLPQRRRLPRPQPCHVLQAMAVWAVASPILTELTVWANCRSSSPRINRTMTMCCGWWCRPHRRSQWQRLGRPQIKRAQMVIYSISFMGGCIIRSAARQSSVYHDDGKPETTTPRVWTAMITISQPRWTSYSHILHTLGWIYHRPTPKLRWSSDAHDNIPRMQILIKYLRSALCEPPFYSCHTEGLNL